jgi:hypothetical protein
MNTFFEVLKEIGVELSAYYGGSLNGKDIKKVMNNATHVFEKVAVSGGRGGGRYDDGGRGGKRKRRY